jgi:riboflavin kinase/FMN adenylyltransferase
MKIYEGWDKVPRMERSVVTVGSFDGVHRGHLALLERLVARARENGGQSVVVTFSPHPREVLSDGVKLITPLAEKAALLERAGVDNLVVAPFTREFSMLSGAEFIALLRDKLGMAVLVAGHNHRFGHDKMGVDAIGAQVDVEVVPHVEGVSSTAIRRLLDEGREDVAAEYLGREIV